MGFLARLQLAGETTLELLEAPMSSAASQLRAYVASIHRLSRSIQRKGKLVAQKQARCHAPHSLRMVPRLFKLDHVEPGSGHVFLSQLD